jgi:hypothetical protein
MYTKDVSANVPLYGQQMCFWCGAASAEMTRNGYPNPADRVYYTQQYLWNTIQAYNSTLPADSGWATDPHGLRGCLQSLSTAPVNWDEFDDPNIGVVLFFMLFWMNRESYPSPVLVNQGGHWVVVVGWETDVEPVEGSNPTLEQIHFFDPEPHNVGTDTTMTGAQWYAGPWNGAVFYPGTWQNQYVAIVEPPVPKGEAKVNTVSRLGTKLLTPEQAVERARRWIEERRLADKPQHGILKHRDSEPHPALLVRDEPRENSAKVVPYYYIVPFGLRNERSDCGSPLARVCVLVNGYTGAFEEITTFGRPLRYLTREEAVNVVATALRVHPNELKNAEVTLMFQSGEITHVRTYPFWRITYQDRPYYVDQTGVLYNKLVLSIPGD